MDGDDLFTNNKIKSLDKLNLDNKKIYLHDHKKLIDGRLIYQKNYKYKQNIIYKTLFNDWPQKICTSSIVLDCEMIKKFYKKNNLYKWKYLAIDSQIILYYYYKNQFKFLNNKWTKKLENINNLDTQYSDYLKKKFWLRRMEQHQLTKQLSRKNNIIDRFITMLCLKIFYIFK